MKNDLHTQTYGDPANPPLVLLHGFMGRGESFSPVIPMLGERYFVVTVDLPGHGRSLFSSMSKSQQPQNLPQAASMVLQSLDVLGMDSFYLYGYSMGGRVAQQVCLLSPERIKHLFLESAGQGIKNSEERNARRTKDEALLENIRTKEDFRQFLIAWHRLPLFRTLAQSPLLPGLLESKLKNNVRELQQALRVMGVGTHPWFGQNLAGRSVPITYFFGEQDAKYKMEAAEAFKIIPRMRIIPFPRASHNMHIQFPQEVVQAVFKAAALV
ncbi:MAG: 2-succinyl-6-hydroxy-2,4-cyclohexadiene-1-carboxylate synthase [Desulfatibacillum sp.]|nr:2-succinyl-6-hydroxy-2,4-cyclohexadiene-1-carboxylate synthase [Desulfatibacillum sp.]